MSTAWMVSRPVDVGTAASGHPVVHTRERSVGNASTIGLSSK